VTRIIAICNQKGGVGKTTTAFHLACAGVRAGLRVLLVDNDPQGNLTSVATHDRVDHDQAGLADVLSDRTHATIRDVVVTGVWAGLDVVPTTGDALAAARDELVVGGVGRESRMRIALAQITDDYDLVLIDCAPSLDQLTVNALTAATSVLIVTEPTLFSENGLAQLLTTIDTVRQYCNHQLAIAGVLVNNYQATTTASRERLDELREAAAQNSLTILDAIVPRRVVISNTVESATALDEWGGRTATELAQAYAEHLTFIMGR